MHSIYVYMLIFIKCSKFLQTAVYILYRIKKLYIYIKEFEETFYSKAVKVLHKDLC